MRVEIMLELKTIFLAGVATPLALPAILRCELAEAAAGTAGARRAQGRALRSSAAHGRAVAPLRTSAKAPTSVLDRPGCEVTDVVTGSDGYRLPMGLLCEQRNALTTRWTIILSDWVECGLTLRDANTLYAECVEQARRTRGAAASPPQVAVSLLLPGRRQESALAAATFRIEHSHDSTATRAAFWDYYVSPLVDAVDGLRRDTDKFWTAWWEANIRGPVAAKRGGGRGDLELPAVSIPGT